MEALKTGRFCATRGAVEERATGRLHTIVSRYHRALQDVEDDSFAMTENPALSGIGPTAEPDGCLLSTEILAGAEALEWVAKDAHAAAWDGLYRRSEWRSPFLSREFFRLWFAHYGNDWTAVLITAWRGPHLIGLIPLARRQGLVTGVGAYQAEYHGWLGEPDDAVAFIEAILARLAEQFPTDLIRLRYLAPGTPAAAIEALQNLPRAFAWKRPRPLVDLDAGRLAEVLKKKRKKSSYNRLQALGTLELKRLGREEFRQYLDQIIRLYDFRQGAISDTSPFAEDPRKREFFLDWMESLPEQLCATALLLDGQLIAAQIALVSGDEVHLLVLAHAPQHARHSPGKLHLYEVAIQLAQEGRRRFDLTPGGDAWKEGVATSHDDVFELEVHPSAASAEGFRRREARERYARTALRKFGIEPSVAKAALSRLRRLTPAKLMAGVVRSLWGYAQLRVYRLDLKEFSTQQSTAPARTDALEDLVKFAPLEPWQSRQTFLADALGRLEAGEHPYTIAEGDRLVHWGWLAPTQSEALFTEVGTRFHYPEAGAVLYDFFTAPAARGRGHYQNSIRQMLADLRQQGHEGPVYIAVLANNRPSRHVIEKLGFEHFCSLYRLRLAGYERKWQRHANRA